MAQDTLPRVRAGGDAARMAVAGDLAASVFARRVGDVSDMVRGDDGTLFAADQRSGRIWVVRDRARDGRADTVQPLPHRFDMPSGLALGGGHLFVADRSGLWRVAGTGTPELLAPFANAGATDAPHPIVLGADGSLRLGLSMPDGSARVLSVDARTGEASLLAQIDGVLHGFSKGPADAPTLLIVERDGETWIGTGPDTLRPVEGSARHAWVDPSNRTVLLSGRTGVRRFAASLLGLDSDPVDILSGTSSGPITADERGVLVAEPERGLIWRLHPRVDATTSDIAPAAPAPEPDPDTLLLKGSGIATGSTLKPRQSSDSEDSGSPPTE